MTGIGVSLGCMLLVKVYTPLAWTWYVLVGTVICVTVGYTVSLAVAAGRRRAGG